MTAERMAAIQARANDPFGTARSGIGQVDDDRDWLLALAREQAAKLDAVREVHKEARRDVEPWAKGYKWTGHHCTHDGQNWPCETIAATEEA